jgi:simple sugar transport system permease protein
MKPMKQREKQSNAFLVAASATVLGLLAGAILMALIGSNPFTGFWYLFRGGLMNIERIGNTMATATTLMLVGLSVAFAFKTGLFNIGASGQMLIGGLCATLVAHKVFLPRPLFLVVLIGAALLGGALWGIIPGFLKAKFNVHEVVATIMMNWIAYWSIYYFIPAYLKGPSLETESASIAVSQSMRSPWLTKLFNGSYMNLAFFVAIAAVLIIKFILDKTTLGFGLKAVGSNRFCAEYAGIKVKRNVVISMMIAGGLAGLAGRSCYTGYSRNMQIGVMPSQGFDGIAVALLGASTPLGVLFSSLFLAFAVGQGVYERHDQCAARDCRYHHCRHHLLHCNQRAVQALLGCDAQEARKQGEGKISSTGDCREEGGSIICGTLWSAFSLMPLPIRFPC